MIAVFVNFAFSNTVFLHTHHGLSGRTVTHSHPYQPSTNHGHTGQSLDLIAAFNVASTSVEAAASPVLQPLSCSYVEIRVSDSFGPVSRQFAVLGLRGPPFAG